jgi:hypothetical protein
LSEWQQIKIADLEEEDEPLAEKEMIEDVEEKDNLRSVFDKIKKEDLTPAGRVVGKIRFE